MRVVHQGSGGFIEIEGCRYAIEHIEAGHFCIHFRSDRSQSSREHLVELHAFAKEQRPQWYVEVTIRRTR